MHRLDLLLWCEGYTREEQIAELEHLWALRDDTEVQLERIWSLTTPERPKRQNENILG